MKTRLTAGQLESNLSQFYGTENYYKHWTGAIVYTDGVKYLGENAGLHGCYWLIDAIASYQNSRRTEPFQVWILKVLVDETGRRSAVLTMQEDTNTPILIKQKIEGTDFQLDEIKLYLIDKVLLLTSEY